MSDLIPISKLSVFDDEPRILDLDLAAWLGFGAARQIRELIARNRDELEAFGSLSCRTTNPGARGGRPGVAYYLNEGQALVICALSRTPKAAEVRKALIEVFMAYRRGKLVQVKEHRRRPPSREEAWDQANRTLQAFRGRPEALIEVLARCCVRLDELERDRA